MTASQLYLRCLGWGLATGAAAGGGLAALVGIALGASVGDVRVTLLVTAAGVFYGTLVAVVPTLLGGLAVVVVLRQRHPRPAALNAVHRDLGVVFVAVVAVLDLAAMVLWVLVGGWSSVPAVLVAVLVVDAVVVLVLKPARSSIAQAWADESDTSGVAGVAPPRT